MENNNEEIKSLIKEIQGLTTAEVWMLLKERNLLINSPLSEDKLKEKFKYIIDIRYSLEKSLEVKNEKEPEIITGKSLTEKLRQDKKQGVVIISEYLISLYSIKTVGKKDNTKEIYIYKDGFYKTDYGLIRKEILEIAQDVVGSHTREEIIKYIKDKTWIEKELFDADVNLINVKNGIYNIKEKKLIPHDPKYLFLHQIDTYYDETADCPKIKEFLNQILDEDSVNVIQELLGYCIYRSHFIKKAFIFLGGKDVGKTTLIRMIVRFLGELNVCGVSLQKLTSDRFALSNLYQKYANIYDDLSFKDIGDNGVFKILTGNGFVGGEKKFGDQFQFKNFAKIIVACNKIPNIKDTDDEAFFSRWIILRFENKPESIDKFLFEKITTKEEMSGLLNFALQGLVRLIEKQNFSYYLTPEDIKKEMNMSSSSLAKFVYEELEVVSDQNQYITKESMAEAFMEYVSNNNLPVISKETIGKRLHKYIPVCDGRKNIFNKEKNKKEQINCWIGVKFKNNNSKTSIETPENNLLVF